MNYHRVFHILLITLFIATGFLAQNSLAGDNDVESLDDILNPKVEENTEVQTSTTLSNEYYKTCIGKKSLIFDDTEKEIMCGCTAANMSENLSVEDFNNLYKETRKGRDARDRMLAYTYAPCMEYAASEKARTDCLASGSLHDIVSGKSLICKCVAKLFELHVNKNAPYIITRASHNEPMALDPLSFYWSNGNYYAQHKLFTKTCRYKFEHHRDNAR